MKKTVIFTCITLLSIASPCTTISDTLYVNRANIPLYSTSIYYCAFNQDTAFSRTNTNYSLDRGDTLSLFVYNNDTVLHNFTIDGVITSGNIVAPGNGIQLEFTSTQQKVYRYYSSLSNGAQLGASGAIQVGWEGKPRFIWNLFDQDSAYATAFHLQTATNIASDFEPGLFFMNGLTYPQTENDSTTLITGMIGDSIYISIVNSGHMVHSIHFHGYHVTIVNSEKTPQMNGWIKDSFPVKVGDRMTVLLVPDKGGMYPVHDHNLIASTNMGLYPGGMMAMLSIMP